jgi:thioredoxin-like negative regulator of GroEL
MRFIVLVGVFLAAIVSADEKIAIATAKAKAVLALSMPAKMLSSATTPKVVEGYAGAVEASYTRPIIVMTTGPNCLPCKFLRPQLESLALSRGTTLYVLDTEKHPNDAAKFQAGRIPTATVISDGLILFHKVGPTVDEVEAALTTGGTRSIRVQKGS